MNEQTARDYLLIRLADEDREAVEEKLFLEPGHFEWLESVEWELIEEYINQQLGETDLHRFEETFLSSSERREKVEFMKAALKGLRKEASPLWLSVAMAVGVLLVGVGLGLVVNRSREASPPVVSQQASERPNQKSIVDVVLVEGQHRGAGASRNSVAVPAEALVLRLHLKLGAVPTSPCHAVVTSADTPKEFAAPSPPTGDGTLSLELAAASLPLGDYVVKAYCSGNHVGSFPFRTILQR